MIQQILRILGGGERSSREKDLTGPKVPPPMSEADSYSQLGVKAGSNRGLIPEWFEKGRHPQVTHLVVRRDQVEEIDYPYFSVAGAAIAGEVESISGENGCDTIAVYNYREPIGDQLERSKRLNY